MPEGDTVHRHAALLQPLIEGQRVVGAASRWPGVVREVVGTEVLAVEAIGKHLLVSLSDGTTLRVHLGMNGRWRRAGSGEALRLSPGDVSLRLDTPEVAVVCTRAPTVERFRTRERPIHPVLSALGPDLLGVAFEPAEAVARVPRSDAPTAAEVLLDQRVACGIGNVYKSELLFLERLPPFTPPAEVSEATWAALYARARTLLSANLGPGARNTTGLGPGRPDHWVYGRSGRAEQWRSPCCGPCRRSPWGRP